MTKDIELQMIIKNKTIMKKKEFLTEAKRKAIISDKEKAILESFAKTFNKIKRIDENEINEFEEENPLYSRMQQHNMNYEKEYLNSEDENTYKVEVIGKEDEKDGGSKHRWVYEITANSEEEAEAKAADKFNENWKLSDIYLFSAKVISNPTDNDVVQGRSVKLSEELGNEGLVDARTTFAYRLVKQIAGILKNEMYNEPDEYGMTTPELLKVFMLNFDAVDNGEGKIIGFKKGDLTSFVARAKRYLENNDLISVDDNGMVDVNNSNSPEIANLLLKLENL